MGSYIVEFIFHISFSFLLVSNGFGLYGIAMVTSFDYFLRFLVLQLFIYYSRFQYHLISFADPDSRKNLYSQLKLSLKSFLMGYWMHRSYQIFSVIAMFLQADVIAAQHICITIVSIFHVLPISFSMAFSVLVGNMIGAKRVKEAKEYVKLAIISGLAWGLFSSLCLVILK